jgi:hypothetical protein
MAVRVFLLIPVAPRRLGLIRGQQEDIRLDHFATRQTNVVVRIPAGLSCSPITAPATRDSAKRTKMASNLFPVTCPVSCLRISDRLG